MHIYGTMFYSPYLSARFLHLAVGNPNEMILAGITQLSRLSPRVGSLQN